MHLEYQQKGIFIFEPLLLNQKTDAKNMWSVGHGPRW